MVIHMERRLHLHGKNTAEKLSHLERILASFQGRLSRSIVGVIPPIPFINYVAEPHEGLLASMLMPISGVVDKAYIRIGAYVTKSAKIEITITSGPQTHSIELECSRLAHSFDIDWSIRAGDLIEVHGEGVSDVHIAFALQPDLSRATKEKHMLEGFKALLEEEERIDAE